MSITQPRTIPQEELLPNAGRSRSGRSTGTRCARKIGNTSVSRRVGRAHWRLESIFSQSDFQGLAVGTYGEISSNVRKMVSIAVEYGYKHLGASILASDLDAVKNSIRRRFHTTIAMASWRGYANMLLGRIQYVGKAYAFNKVQRQYRLVEHLDQGAFGSWSCAHLMDRPLPSDLHPSGWAY